MKEVRDKLPNTFDGKNENAMGGHIPMFLRLLTFGGYNNSHRLIIRKGAHLNYEDVAMDRLHSPRLVKVRIRASKTDPFRVGVDIFFGKTANQLCPVTAILSYMYRLHAGG